jgi:predicted ATP-grasp superfamily ATP-dependent carboligase
MRTSAPARTVFVYEYVTGGGLAGSELHPSWTAEGNAMRRALVEDFAAVPGLRVVTTRDHRLQAEPGPWSTLSVGAGEELETFRRLASEADYTVLIAPETDGLLHERAAILEELDRPSLGCTSSAIALAGNKWLLAARLEEHAIPTPTCRLIDATEEPADDIRYPAVIKPVDGAGSVNTFFVPSLADWPEDARAMQVALIQPFVDGIPMSASFLVLDDRRKVLLGLATQQMDFDAQRFVYRGGRIVPETVPVPLDDLFRTVDAVGGLRGWVGVDFIWDAAASRVVVVEINPRLTTSYVGFRRLAPPGDLARIWYTSIAHSDEFDAQSWAQVRIHAGSLSYSADGSIGAEVFAA